MNVGIVGASGLVGGAVRAALEDRGHTWTGFSRNPDEREGDWRRLEDGFAGLDAVVNVAGESIAKRWTEENKKRFHESRVGVTDDIVAQMAALPDSERPQVLVNASAVGYYGDQGEDILTEESPMGSDYLAGLCEEWEAAAVKAEELGVRVALGRIGVVLGKEADAWTRMKVIFKLGAGGRLGDGKQFWPTVHLDDVAGGIVHSLETTEVRGAVNLVGPNPVTNAEFTRVLAEVLHRPASFPVPPFALKLVLGDFANALLASYRAQPTVLERTGYEFKYAKLKPLLESLN
ncbi:TIGR01777 family oxidoreductase [Roseibacillus persicicus]|uniref:TIGR01777 family oxidoreductase n=1 Tax=Roseibacillus persicicus TaxID=454148 RepID=UPI00398AAFA5